VGREEYTVSCKRKKRSGVIWFKTDFKTEKGKEENLMWEDIPEVGRKTILFTYFRSHWNFSLT
jgi:hypothetical protein